MKTKIIFSAFLAIFLAACDANQHNHNAHADHSKHQASAQPDAMLHYARPTPEFQLTDHLGQPQDKSMLNGQWQLLFFGFTSCPAVCPETLATLQAANKHLQGKLPKVILISVDPETDTPQQLKNYLSHYQIQSAGLTGAMPQIRQFSKALFLPLSEVASSAHGGLDHTDKVVLVNPKAEVVAYLQGRQPADQLADKLEKILLQHTGKNHKKI